MKRLIKKADLQDKCPHLKVRKEKLIDVVVANGLVKDISKLEVLTYDELVDIIVDSQKFYIVEL